MFSIFKQLNLRKNLLISFAYFLFFFAFGTLTANAYFLNTSEVLSTSFCAKIKKSGSSFGFGKLAYHQASDNSVDSIKHQVETVMAKYYSYGQDIQTYYCNENTDNHTPAEIIKDGSVLIPDISVLSPITKNNNDISIAFDSMMLSLVSPPFVTQSTQTCFFLPFETAEKLAVSLHYADSSQLIGKQIELNCRNFSSSVKTQSFLLGGIFTKETDSSYFGRYNDFIVVSEQTRKTFFGCKEIDFRMEAHPVSLYSYVSNVETFISHSGDTTRQFIYSRYYTFEKNHFSSDYMETISKNIKNLSNDKAKFQALLVPLCFLISFVFVYLKKRGFLWVFQRKPEKRSTIFSEQIVVSLSFLTWVSIWFAIGKIPYGIALIPTFSCTSAFIILALFILVQLSAYFDNKAEGGLHK